jgi:eukaryotic-like serine/threonine-protein kinase
VETQELAGRRLGDRYALEEPIASGGMARVWRATDEVLGRPVAVKVLYDTLARDATLLERFRMEAVAAARLSHPAVVRVFDTGIDDGICYIVMELFEGATLAHVIDTDGPLSPQEAARVVGGALQGLAHAHGEGIIHRDVKPSNILVGPGGTVKVTDFGIAKAAFAEGEVTTTGNLLGTAKYLAPEQVHDGEVDARADLYSAGIVLYEALTGRAPFEAESHLATATMRLTRDPTPPGSLRPGIPRGVEAVVLKALARPPEERFQSAEEMSGALARAVPSSVLPPTRPRRGRRPERSPARRDASFFRSWMLVPLILLLVAALAVGGFFLFDEVLLGGAGGNGQEAGGLQRLRISSAEDHDPLGDGSENDSAVPSAFDGEPTTSWTTEGYEQSNLGGLKPGVGIFFDLGRPLEVSEFRLRSNLPGWTFEIQGSNDGETFSDPLELELEPATYQYFRIWITEAAPAPDGRYRGDVAEVDFLGPE